MIPSLYLPPEGYRLVFLCNLKVVVFEDADSEKIPPHKIRTKQFQSTVFENKDEMLLLIFVFVLVLVFAIIPEFISGISRKVNSASFKSIYQIDFKQCSAAKRHRYHNRCCI